ncbi:3-hydroxylacyl-ACP dehydratase [Microbulbifer sp. A4B17]|uniref:ApeP family dehydratase n=1 Tax=Microbulbifer sp. A4B17 TaxID=359370 RepID=UPI000D52C09A|nr:hotdog family protein [Microbulbifer sp. A4B17]AWF79419.1 3-hydroxylacyl-ACP dehydratase [Microbulbifer sp. A4B17]
MHKYTAEELVPHSGNMSLLDEVISVGEEQLQAKLRVRDDGIFSRNGRVPAYVGIEYMAQSIAAFSGYHAKEQGKDVRLGFLLGTRKFLSNIESYRCGEELTIDVERILQAENGMATFECVITGSSIEQSARLNVFQPDNVEQYLKERN